MNKNLKSNKSISRVKKVTSPAKQRETITKSNSLDSVNLPDGKNKPVLTKVSKKMTKTINRAKEASELITAKENLVSQKNGKENKILTACKEESESLEKLVNTDSSIKNDSTSEVKKSIQESRSFVDEQELPSHYGTTYLRLMVRDPFWIYAYWEISETSWKKLTEKLSFNEVEGAKTVLRLYEVSLVDFNGKNANHYFDIDAGAYKNNWYINLWSDNLNYVGEIGIRTQSGDFFALSRSNCVNTPRVGYSPRTEQMWMEFIDRKEYSRYIIARIKKDKKNEGLEFIAANKKRLKIIYLNEDDIKNYYKVCTSSLKDVLSRKFRKNPDKKQEQDLLSLEGASKEERKNILSKLPKGYEVKKRLKGASEEIIFVGDSESIAGLFPGASEFSSGHFIGASECFFQE